MQIKTIGRILEILQSTETIESLSILLQTFKINSIDEMYKCPVLLSTKRTISVKTSSILALLNVQHDCRHSKCPQGSLPEIQEGDSTENTRSFIKHVDDDRFILNIYTFRTQSFLADILEYQPLDFNLDEAIMQADLPDDVTRRRRVNVAAAKSTPQRSISPAASVTYSSRHGSDATDFIMPAIPGIM
jgi:hypothetical protein